LEQEHEADVDKKMAMQEAQLEEEEAAMNAGITGNMAADMAAVLGPTLPPAPSPMACKATKDGNSAKIAANEAFQAQAQLLVMQKLTKFKGMKAKRYQEKAMASYKEAMSCAMQDAKEKGDAAEKVGKAADAMLQKSASPKGGADQHAIDAAQAKAEKAATATQKAECAEQKAMAKKKAGAERAQLTAVAKARADLDAKAATAAVVKVSEEANEAMANIKKSLSGGCP
jgi:hypothetical protein